MTPKRSLVLMGPAILTSLAILLTGDSFGATPAGGLAPSNMSDAGVSAQSLADSLKGFGVTISPGAAYTGAANGAGIFSGADTGVVGFTSGVILGTGWVKSDVFDRPNFCLSHGVEGPNECSGASADNAKAGDTALDTLSNSSTKDAAILTFSFVPAAGTVTLEYVFTSEDYLEGIGRGFADALGVLVNGQNCATVGSPPVRVSVDTINNTTRPELYRNNPSKERGGTPGINAEPNGLTAVLTCSASVTAGVSNTIKLAIADVGDSAIDSNVFFKAGSLNSPSTTSAPVAPGLPAAKGVTGPASHLGKAGNGQVDHTNEALGSARIPPETAASFPSGGRFAAPPGAARASTPSPGSLLAHEPPPTLLRRTAEVAGKGNPFGRSGRWTLLPGLVVVAIAAAVLRMRRRVAREGRIFPEKS